MKKSANFILVIMYINLIFSLNVFASAKSENYEIESKNNSAIKIFDTIQTTKYEAKFQNKYQTVDFNYQQNPIVKTFFQRFISWLSQKIASIFNISNSSKTHKYASNLVIFLAVIIVGVAVYFIIKIIKNKEGHWIFGKSISTNINYSDLENNLQTVDFEKLIAQTNLDGNFRLEIRYYYLWILKKLAERNFIVFNAEKTNSDYLNEIKSDKIKSDFKYVSYLYNYIWYGEFTITTDNYNNSKNAFLKMLQSL